MFSSVSLKNMFIDLKKYINYSSVTKTYYAAKVYT